MAETFPPRAFIIVRGMSDDWVAMVAVEGGILARARFESHAEAIEAAALKASHNGPPSLVERAPA